MDTTSSWGVALDQCSQCAGVWFDDGELASVAKTTPDALKLLDAERLPTMELLNAPGRRKQCPRCATPLSSYHYAYSSPVLLDSCPQCHGIFVEDQEMDAIGQLMRQAPPQRLNAVAASRAKLTGGSGVGGPDAERQVARLVQALQHWDHIS